MRYDLYHIEIDGTYKIKKFPSDCIINLFKIYCICYMNIIYKVLK